MGTHWNTLYPDCVRNIHVVISEWVWLYGSRYALKCIAPLFPIGTRNLRMCPTPIRVLVSRDVAVCTAGRVHTAGRAMITNTIHTACRVYSI